MTAPREHVLRKARQWAAYADEDIRLAQQALNMGEQCPNRLAAYHAQQCAEKYLKAYLVHKEVDFPFTHNISLLLELCEESGAWAGTLRDAEALTRYAVTTRYPGEEPKSPWTKRSRPSPSGFGSAMRSERLSTTKESCCSGAGRVLPLR